MAPAVDWAEMISYRWDISGHGLPVLGRSGFAILLMALDGEGRRDSSLKARDGASTARNGAAATRRRGTVQCYGNGWHDGTKATRRQGTVEHSTRARQGTARRLHDGKGRCGATAMDGATARRLHDGKGRSSTARERQGLARLLHNGEGRREATAMDGATAKRLHDGEGLSGTMAMGCGDCSLTARRL